MLRRATMSSPRRIRAPLAWIAAVATCIAGLLMPSLASAGTYGPVGCSLNSGAACISTERHTYNDNGAYAPNASGAYIAAWLKNPSTGTDINVVYGYGTVYRYYRANTNVFLDGYWGNYSGSSPVYVQGTFHY